MNDFEEILMRIERLLSDEDRIDKQDMEFLWSLQEQLETEAEITAEQLSWLEEIEAKFGIDGH